MRVLLTVVAWAAVSFLFTWRWGTAISCVGDTTNELPADPAVTGGGEILLHGFASARRRRSGPVFEKTSVGDHSAGVARRTRG